MKLDIPKIRPIDYEPEDLLPFNYCRSKPNYNATVHFFLDDYQFERVWNYKQENIKLLTKFQACLTPDFSLYRDMPIAMQIWNVYRSRYLGKIWQEANIKVIPTVSWSDERSFNFCFDGIATHSIIAISTVGVCKNKEAKKYFFLGIDEVLKRLCPKTIILYGNNILPSQIQKDVKIINFSSFSNRTFHYNLQSKK